MSIVQVGEELGTIYITIHGEGYHCGISFDISTMSIWDILKLLCYKIVHTVSRGRYKR